MHNIICIHSHKPPAECRSGSLGYRGRTILYFKLVRFYNIIFCSIYFYSPSCKPAILLQIYFYDIRTIGYNI